MSRKEFQENIPPDFGEVVDTPNPEALFHIATRVARDFANRNFDKYLELVFEGKMSPLR